MYVADKIAMDYINTAKTFMPKTLSSERDLEHLDKALLSLRLAKSYCSGDIGKELLREFFSVHSEVIKGHAGMAFFFARVL